MASSNRTLLGIGTACLDHLVLWSDLRAPVMGNRVLDCSSQGGGMAATGLVAAARLGFPAELWASVGADPTGDLIVRELEREGVDTRHVERVAGGRGPVAVVNVDQTTGERAFAYWSGRLDDGRVIGALDRLAEAGCLLVDCTMHATAVPAMQEARRLGVPVVCDLEKPHRAVGFIEHVDYVIASEDSLAALGTPGDPKGGCEVLRAMGPRLAAITLGGRGVLCYEGDRWIALPAFKVPVVDTTGAGDVFHGAFCCGLIEGLETEQNLRRASAVAALKCRRLGGRAGIPTRAEAEAFLEQQEAGTQDARSVI